MKPNEEPVRASSAHDLPSRDADVALGKVPMQVDVGNIVRWGMVVWAGALLAVLLVPNWHSGDRWWWPWTCVAGLVVGAWAWWYTWRGRGNIATT